MACIIPEFKFGCSDAPSQGRRTVDEGSKKDMKKVLGGGVADSSHYARR